MINIDIIGDQNNDGSTMYKVYSGENGSIKTNNWSLYNFFRDNPNYDWDTIGNTRTHINDYCMSVADINFKKLEPGKDIVLVGRYFLEEVSWIAIAAHFAGVDVSLLKIVTEYSNYMTGLLQKFMEDPTTVQVRAGDGYSYEDCYDQFSMNFNRNKDGSISVAVNTSFFNADNAEYFTLSNQGLY